MQHTLKSRNNISNSKVNIANRIWQLVYPLLVYYVLYSVVTYLARVYLEERFGHLICLMIAGIVTMIPIAMIYKDSPVVKVPITFEDKRRLLYELLGVLGVVALAISLNYIIGATGLIQTSESFEVAQKNLYDGSVLVKLLCNAIIIPILEELLFRGIIAGQLQVWCGMGVAVLLSSIAFGMMHLNIVQFVYAFLCGIALGILYCKTNKLMLCMLAHGLANLIVVIATTVGE